MAMSCSDRESQQSSARLVVRPRRLRVLHVVDRFGVGGTEHGILKVVQGLDCNEFEQQVCAIRGCSEGLGKAQQLQGSVEFIPGSESGFRFLVGRLARLMRRLRPDVVHSRNWGAIEAVLAARVASVPIAIHSEHGYEVDMFRGLPWHRRLARRMIYAAADSVFAVTRELRDYHARQAQVPPDRIGVVYNGVDTFRFRPISDECLATREALKIPREAFVIGSVGRMVEIKDYPTLLKAAEIVLEKRFDLRVILAGAGPERTRLEQIANSSARLRQRVHFLGERSDPEKVMNAMDVFVLPSLREGMSNTLLEASACGAPVIAANVGGNTEIIENEQTGWLFEAGNSNELADLLLKLANAPALRKETGERGRMRVVSQFSLEAMLKSYRNLYLRAAQRKRLIGGPEADETCAA